MEPITNLLHRKIEESPPVTKVFKAARRKLAIDDLKETIGWIDDPKIKKKQLWFWLTNPIYIKTEILEVWKQRLILHSAYKNKRNDRLFELLKETRNGN